MGSFKSIIIFECDLEKGYGIFSESWLIVRKLYRAPLFVSLIKHYIMKTLFFLVLILCNIFKISSQNNKKIILDSEEKTPVPYATIKSINSYAISNENGEFSIENLSGILNIQSLGYQNLEINFENLLNKDTIYMKPFVYQLDEVALTNDDKFQKMIRTILSDYALEPHQESFFLRATIKKNNEFYKIIDFSGNLEKQTLFGTSKKPMPKNNYTIHIENIRKVGIENRYIDIKLLDFNNFLTQIASIYLSPKIYNISYQISDNKNYSKVILTPEDDKTTFTNGFYTLNDDNTFNEVEMIYENKNATFENVKDIKFRTIYFKCNTSFLRNIKTNKLQLNKAILKSISEVYTKDSLKDIFEVSYIFYAKPIDTINLKNNVNLKKDIFDLNFNYDEVYWKNQEILPLTNDMQEFINKVNSSGKNSDFRTKTNMN